MALIDGDDFVSGNIGSFQELTRLKNHWRASAAPSNPSPGMLFSDEDDEKLYHFGDDSISPDEVLQANRSFDTSPIFDNLFLDLDSGALSDPPTAAELAGIFGSNPGEGFLGFVQDSDSAAKLYLVFFGGGVFYYQELTAAA